MIIISDTFQQNVAKFEGPSMKRLSLFNNKV